MENKKAITKFSKIMIVSQGVLLILFFIFVIYFTPILDYPNNGENLLRKDIDFRFRNANAILIDTNENFNSPRLISKEDLNASKILFEPGVYYWKAVGVVESIPRKFIVDSSVGLEINEENSTIINVGDSILKINLEDSFGGITGLSILDVGVEYPVKLNESSNFEGEYYEK